MPFDDDDFESPDAAPALGVLAIPYQRLSAEALDAIIGEFVSREGTDYGDYHYSFDDKKNQVLSLLQHGKASLLFDPSNNSCHIELSATLRRHGWLEGEDGQTQAATHQTSDSAEPE